MRSSLSSLLRNTAGCSPGFLVVSGNDDLFDRPEIVRFFRLFTREGDMTWSTRAAVIPQSTQNGNGRFLAYIPS